MEVLPGPDFPTGALVMGKSGIHICKGDWVRGSIVLRSRTEIEETKTGRIVVTNSHMGQQNQHMNILCASSGRTMEYCCS